MNFQKEKKMIQDQHTEYKFMKLKIFPGSLRYKGLSPIYIIFSPAYSIYMRMLVRMYIYVNMCICGMCVYVCM